MMKFKQIFSYLLTITLIVNLFSQLVLADDGDAFIVDEFKYKVLSEANATIEVISNSYTQTDYTIPATVEYNGKNYSVVAIGDNAFYNCTSLISITIPNSVTAIGDYTFSNCTSLISITIPNRVTAIGNYTFYNCTSMTSITIPNSVTSIGDVAFYNCTSMTSITIPNSVTSIGEATFYGWTSLTSISIPNSVTSIGIYAFGYCSSLTSVTIPNSVTAIAPYAFFNCTSLISVTIPDSVTSIGNYAFGFCTSLKSITIPDRVTAIGNYAFFNCTSLTSVTIPDSVTAIGIYAFGYCSSLTSVTIPNSVASIGEGAFSYCSSLTSVTFNHSATDLGLDCFINVDLTNKLRTAYQVRGIGEYVLLNGEWVEPVVDSVTISSPSLTIRKGKSRAFVTAVIGTQGQNQAVTWEITGQNSLNTNITQSGLLSVGADEAAKTIIVKATALADTTKFATATVTLENTGGGGFPPSGNLPPEEPSTPIEETPIPDTPQADDAQNTPPTASPQTGSRADMPFIPILLAVLVLGRCMLYQYKKHTIS